MGASLLQFALIYPVLLVLGVSHGFYLPLQYICLSKIFRGNEGFILLLQMCTLRLLGLTVRAACFTKREWNSLQFFTLMLIIFVRLAYLLVFVVLGQLKGFLK